MLRNADRLIARLDGMRHELRGLAEQAVSAAAGRAAETARSLVPVDTGELKGSISVQGGGLEARVAAGVGHAAAVEFGTSKMPARPFMQPAAESARAGFGIGGIR